MGEGAHPGAPSHLQTGLPSKQDSKVWRTLDPASEAQLMDVGGPHGDGRESITQLCSGRAEQRNKQKRAGIWSFGLAPPPQFPHQTCLPLPPPSVLSPRSLSAYCPLGWTPPHPASLTSISAHLPMCSSGASSPKEAPETILLFQTPMTFVSETGVTALSTSLY